MEIFAYHFPSIYLDAGYKGWFVSTVLLCAWSRGLPNGPAVDWWKACHNGSVCDFCSRLRFSESCDQGVPGKFEYRDPIQKIIWEDDIFRLSDSNLLWVVWFHSSAVRILLAMGSLEYSLCIINLSKYNNSTCSEIITCCAWESRDSDGYINHVKVTTTSLTQIAPISQSSRA